MNGLDISRENGMLYAYTIDDLRAIHGNYLVNDYAPVNVKYVRYLKSLNKVLNEDYDRYAICINTLMKECKDTIIGDLDDPAEILFSIYEKYKEDDPFRVMFSKYSEYLTLRVNHFIELSLGLKIDDYLTDYRDLRNVLLNNGFLDGKKLEQDKCSDGIKLMQELSKIVITSIKELGILLEPVKVDDVRISGIVSLPIYEDCYVLPKDFLNTFYNGEHKKILEFMSYNGTSFITSSVYVPNMFDKIVYLYKSYDNPKSLHYIENY